jgi:hypothetical protein
MGYKNKVFSEMAKEFGKDIGKAARVSGKFVKDAFLTEIIPRKFKSKLKDKSKLNNYNPDFYVKNVRYSLKFGAGVLGGCTLAYFLRNTDLLTMSGLAIPFAVGGVTDANYGMGDYTGYHISSRKHDSYLPPAAWPIEFVYNAAGGISTYFSNLHNRALKRI